MNRIYLNNYIFFFLSTVQFPYFKRIGFRTYRASFPHFWRASTGFLEVGV